MHLFLLSSICPGRAKRFLCWVLSLSILGLSISSSASLAQTTADQTDTQPPLIEFEAVEEGYAGDIQVFNVAVSDDRDLLAVLLFYRFAGEEQFASLDMEPLEGTPFFAASVATSEEDLRSIEYFIQAEDTAGNRAIKGFTFDPLIRRMLRPDEALVSDSTLATTSAEDLDTALGPEPQATAANAETAASGGAANRSRIWWGLLGLVAVAAIAVALSDDDDSDDNPAINPVTLVPTTGQLLSIEW